LKGIRTQNKKADSLVKTGILKGEIQTFVYTLKGRIEDPTLSQYIPGDILTKFTNPQEVINTATGDGIKGTLETWGKLIEDIYKIISPKNPKTKAKLTEDGKYHNLFKGVQAHSKFPPSTFAGTDTDKDKFFKIANLASAENPIYFTRKWHLEELARFYKERSETLAALQDKLKYYKNKDQPNGPWPEKWQSAAENILNGGAAASEVPRGAEVVEQDSQAFLPNLRPMSFV